MLEESVIVAHLSVAMTTTEVTQITTENSLTSSLLLDVKFYVESAVMVLGLVGTAANALILYGLVASRQHKKHVLIFNQNALDLFSSFFLVVTYAVKLCSIRLTGSLGYWLCVMVYSDVFIWWGITGSTINLASITVERYLKVVHPVWSKKKLRSWMIYSAAGFAWIFCAVYDFALVAMTTVAIDGTCYANVIWQNETARVIHFIWYFMSFYVIVLLIFTLGYWRILTVIRRQARVMAGYRVPGSNTGQTMQLSLVESSVVKTMILVSALFAISQLPGHIFYLLMNVNPNLAFADVAYFTTLFIAFLYICANPFIYAIKFGPVEQAILRLIPCRRSISDQAHESIELAQLV